MIREPQDYLARKASAEECETGNSVHRGASERPSPSEEEQSESPTTRGGTDELRPPAPIDPPDNQSLPGDPSVTRPDY